ncbi:transcriptional repressor CTCFL [Platysternon megacephalum]|uniref:Transcriptional repressor CTCFL n=1 Tax=Platysternon megacephalum TaxID=55544 RepID=A0A4D9EIL8_9SAUR|nr:transcriptional repressor CTCFL [Platysternon megacephalum]
MEVQATAEDLPFKSNNLICEKTNALLHSCKISPATLCSLRIYIPAAGNSLSCYRIDTSQPFSHSTTRGPTSHQENARERSTADRPHYCYRLSGPSCLLKRHFDGMLKSPTLAWQVSPTTFSGCLVHFFLMWQLID